MKQISLKKEWFVYRVKDRLKLVKPNRNGAFIYKLKDELQPSYSDDLAVGWNIIGSDGKPQITEYPE